jgi:hypothetical protein
MVALNTAERHERGLLEGMTMQAIITKAIAPTNRHNGRLVATSASGKRFYIDRDHEISDDENHAAAALMLAACLEWEGEMVGGTINGKGDMAWVFTENTSPRINAGKVE